MEDDVSDLDWVHSIQELGPMLLTMMELRYMIIISGFSYLCEDSSKSC